MFNDLLKDLQVADVEVKTYPNSSQTLIVYLESMTNADLIGCVIEIPISEAKKYNLTY